MKVTLTRSRTYQGYCLKIDPENECLSVENPQGKEVARLVLDDFLDRLGASSAGFKRQFPRLGIGVYVKHSDSEGRMREGIASTISGGGIFIDELDPLLQGSDTLLQLSLPASRDPIVAKAKVAWVRKGFLRKLYYPGMGLQFVEIPEAGRRALIDFVNRFNQQRGFEEF